MKTIIKILASLGLIGAIAVVAFLFWLRILWTDVYSQQQFDEVVARAQAAPQLPGNFKATLLKVHPTILSDGYFKNMFRSISNEREHIPCPCRWLSNMIMPDHQRMSRNTQAFYGASFTWAVERRLDQERCLSLLLGRYDFTRGIRGIEHASQAYFGDSLANLSEDQHLELIMKLRNR